MITYTMFLEIRRLYEDKKLNSNQIAQELGIDQKTVSRWIKRNHFEKVKRAMKEGVLSSYKKRIQGLLDKHPYSGEQIFNIIKEEGYKGAYSTLSHYIHDVRPPKKKPYLTLSFEPGEMAQVDFANCGNIRFEHSSCRLYAFIMTLCYSRMIYVEFICRQNQEHFLQCHRNAFEYFNGVPHNIMVDNCKAAVLEHSFYGDVKLNPRYADFAGHYGFKIKPCNVRRPNEKGQVERAVDYLKRNFLSSGNEINSLTSVNNAVKYWMENTANVRKHATTLKKPLELFEEEKKELQVLNIKPYDCADIKHLRANSSFRVTFETNRYSVPAEFASTILTVKVYPGNLLFYYNDNLVAEHVRSFDKNRDFENPEHVRKLLEYKKNAKDQKMMKTFLSVCHEAEHYYNGLKQARFNVKGHIRKILALMEIYGKEKMVRAIKDALELGAFSCEYVANILEQRERLKQEASPLHLTRKSDCLDIELEEPDLSFYSKKEEEF